MAGAGLAVSVPIASPPLARASASAYPALRACAIPSSSSSSTSSSTFRSSPLRAIAGLPGSRRAAGRRASIVCAVQGQDATIEGTRLLSLLFVFRSATKLFGGELVT